MTPAAGSQQGRKGRNRGRSAEGLATLSREAMTCDYAVRLADRVARVAEIAPPSVSHSRRRGRTRKYRGVRPRCDP